MSMQRQPFSLPIRLRQWLSWPGRLLVLVLVAGGMLIALLHGWLGDYVSPTVHRTTDLVLIGVVFPLCIALIINQLVRVRRESAIAQTRAVEQERRRISRELHDSIAQHIGYLHFRLDSLAGDDAIAATAAIRQELEQMREVTGEAYDQIYGMLAELRVPGSAPVAETLLARAKWVGSRAGFRAALVTHGEPCALLAQSRQQILYIFREALSNVEKHASARHVDIDVAWQAHDLVIALRDDGRGFAIGGGSRPGHFGLGIMHERADQIQGQLSIESRLGAGTAVRLSVPLERNRDVGPSALSNGDGPVPDRGKS
jgi:nitrate/nitrite-specific signal transduction histidine kinase